MSANRKSGARCDIDGHDVQISRMFNGRYEVGVDGWLEGTYATADEAIFAAREQVRMLDKCLYLRPEAPHEFCDTVNDL
jgi:hypothetical protein